MAKKRGKYKSTARGYTAYRNLFLKRKEELAEKGLTMGKEMFTEEQWEKAYRTEKTIRENQILNGKRKTIGDINRELVREQSYHLSKRQAEVMQEALERKGIKASLQAVRFGKVSLAEDIEARRKEIILEETLKAGENEDKLEQVLGIARRRIAQEFFGSP